MNGSDRPSRGGRCRTLMAEVLERKRTLGKELLILGHHYQRQDVIDVADFRGDSLALSRLAAAEKASRYIVFCGVQFMAESAEILRGEHQVVQHPAPDAGCPLADMADVGDVEPAWNEVARAVDETDVIPVAYMNSSAALKAFCGRKGGTVCTSSNAHRVFRWALDRGKKVFFFPDEHLGRNTARRVGIRPEEILLWDPKTDQAERTTRSALEGARLLLWKGFCHVHTHFRVAHVMAAREEHPEARVVVHPECPEDVVAAADEAGSTEFILRFVREAPPGSVLYVGTEINFVNRLAREYPDRSVLALAMSLCPDMVRIDLGNLLRTLDGIGEVNRVYVPEGVKEQARMALDRMLALG